MTHDAYQRSDQRYLSQVQRSPSDKAKYKSLENTCCNSNKVFTTQCMPFINTNSTMSIYLGQTKLDTCGLNVNRVHLRLSALKRCGGRPTTSSGNLPRERRQSNMPADPENSVLARAKQVSPGTDAPCRRKEINAMIKDDQRSFEDKAKMHESTHTPRRAAATALS